MSGYTVTIDGHEYTVHLIRRRGAALTFTINEREYTITASPEARPLSVSITPLPARTARREAKSGAALSALQVSAPLPGIISDVKVSVGDTVSAGATLIVIEAMKMENPIKAPRDATIKEVHVVKGREVAQGAPLISFE